MRVSVVIPVYRAEAFLRDAVASALALPEVTEVVLVEDGSPDGSLAVCEELRRELSKVRLHRHPDGVNRGASASRNLGMRMATEEFLAFLDADDRFLPNRFHDEKKVWQEHPDADGVYGATGVLYHDEAGRTRFEHQFANQLTTVRKALPPEQLFGAFLGLQGELDFGHFCLDALTLKRASLQRMNQLFREDVEMGEDTEFLMRASARLRLYPGSITEAIALRGVHEGNRVTRDPQRDRSRKRMYAALLEWARTDPAGQRGLARLGEEHACYAVRSAASSEEKRAAWRSLFAYPGSLKRMDNWQAAIAMSFGGVKWLAAGLRWLARRAFGFIWWLKGGAPPEVRSTWEPTKPA
jgi:glycosyltransferase involved in cell wall biosynthesis